MPQKMLNIYILDMSLKIDDLILQAHFSGANELRLAPTEQLLYGGLNTPKNMQMVDDCCVQMFLMGGLFHPYPAGLFG